MAEGEAFDVVIVGGGAAGCVVAARLSESGSRSVLLLEAGPDLGANVPAELRDGWHLSQVFDWGYTSQPDARGVVEDLRRGKLLGGTSWVTRFALRGSPADYDEWAALGNPGWGFEDVLPYLTRLEADGDFGDQPWHGDRGPLPVCRYLDLELTEIAAADHGGVDIDCGYRGPAHAAPTLHLVATFHSSAASSDEAADLMLWLLDPRGDPPTFELDIVLLRPCSRGSIRLRSADPTEPPRIELPGLRDSYDVERLAEAYLRGLEVASRPEIRRLCTDLPSPHVRGEAVLHDMIRTEGYSFPHVVGTCTMGPRPEDGAVVDTSGRVHGSERLSVVDASIVPNGPSAFTHIPTVMLAERLSEQISALL